MTIPFNQFLSPEPAQMHAFLDRWKATYEELVRLIETERAEHESQVHKLRLDITRLEQQLATQSAPYEAEVESLKSEIRLLHIQVRDANQIWRDAMVRLAPIVEMNPQAKGTTLDSIITQVVMFVDESKRQFRESL